MFVGAASGRFVAAIFRGGAVTKNARYQAASCGCGEYWGAGLEVGRLHEGLRSPILFLLALQGCAAFPPVAMRTRHSDLPRALAYEKKFHPQLHPRVFESRLKKARGRGPGAEWVLVTRQPHVR